MNIANNVAANEVPWDTICSHAQQAAEKLLKGFLVLHGRPLVRTHDLVALLARCVEIDPTLAGLEEPCRALTSVGLDARYPSDLYEPGEEDGREMIAAARRVRDEVLGRLPTSGSLGSR